MPAATAPKEAAPAAQWTRRAARRGGRASRVRKWLRNEKSPDGEPPGAGQEVTDPHPGKVTWPIDDHTVAKHKLLESYLGAWLPILASWSKGLNFIDGFAGPGEYEGKEEGSPVIALRAATEHKLRLPSEIHFLFIESNEARAVHLRELLGSRFPNLPNGWEYLVESTSFDRGVTAILDEFDKRGTKLAPTLVFVDPFGFTEFPMATLKRILETRHCEVFVTFMSGFVSRFLEEDRAGALDALFGCSDWRTAKALHGQDRIDCLVNLYERQLRASRADVLARSFEIRGSNDRALYHLVFATRSLRGLEEMKEAMFRLDKLGLYRFSDYLGLHQKTLLDYSPESPAPWTRAAALLTWEHFGGKRVDEDQVYRWTIVASPYVYRTREVLATLEDAGAICDVTGRVKRRSFPDGSSMRFTDWPGREAASRALEIGAKPGPSRSGPLSSGPRSPSP